MRIPFDLSIRAFAPSREQLTRLFCLLAMMLAAEVSVSAATITFFVSTLSQSDATSCNGAAGCSVENNGKSTYNTNTGATTQISGNSTASGTANVLGLTSSFDQSTANGGGFLPPYPALNSSSYAAANLAAAVVRASASGNAGTANNGAVTPVPGYSVAEIFDTLTFTVAGATASTITDIGINTSLSGGAAITFPDGNVEITDTLTIRGGDAQFADSFGELEGNSPPITVNQFGWVSENVVSATTSSFIFQGVTSGQGTTFSIPIDLKLVLDCQGSTCDYSDTGTVSLNLPSNVTFTSASGVFLTEPAEAPEPASWAMILASLIVAGGFAMYRRGSIRLNS